LDEIADAWLQDQFVLANFTLDGHYRYVACTNRIRIVVFAVAAGCSVPPAA
jgi:hypothetical protein